jgi:aspartate aminotransferase-like enzyme
VKGKTFRISSMGDETEASMAEIYAKLDKAIAGL